MSCRPGLRRRGGLLMNAGLKIVAAGILLWVVALAIVTFGEDADATIYDLNVLQEDPKSAFEAAMEDIGLEGTEYDYNGTRVSYATAQVEGKPAELARTIQERLAKRGANSRSYGFHEDSQVYRTGMLKGDVVPTHVSENRIIMSAIGEDLTDEGHPLKEAMLQHGGRLPEDVMKGYRYVEILSRGIQNTHSTVRAVWTGDDFEPQRIVTSEGEYRLSPDVEIPACMGCVPVERMMPWGGGHFRTVRFETDRSPREVVDFYRQTLTARGWQMTDASQELDRIMAESPGWQMPGEDRTFIRGDAALRLVVSSNQPASVTLMLMGEE